MVHGRFLKLISEEAVDGEAVVVMEAWVALERMDVDVAGPRQPIPAHTQHTHPSTPRHLCPTPETASLGLLIWVRQVRGVDWEFQAWTRAG
jgi:hypothetical protein